MSRNYFNQKAAIWDETVAEKDGSKLEHMAGRLGIEPKSNVLDLGSGSGVLLPYLLNYIGGEGRLVALDFAESKQGENPQWKC